MKILVTGGCGFIGSNFILHVLKKHRNYEILNLDKLTYAGNKENLSSVKNNPRYEFVKGDICDGQLVNSLMRKSVAVVHFAAETHVDRSILHAEDFINTNVVGTHILLEAALRNGKKRSLFDLFKEFKDRSVKFNCCNYYKDNDQPHSFSITLKIRTSR